MTSSGRPTSGEGIRAHHYPQSCGGQNSKNWSTRSFHVCLRGTVEAKRQHSVAIGYLVVRTEALNILALGIESI